MSDDEHDDRKKRTTTLDDLLGNREPPELGYSAEWWARRDAEVAAQRAKDAAELERSRMAQRAGELRDNGFPEMFVAAALAELEDTEPMRFAKMFVQLPRKLLVLAGGVGVGKTTAATWVALKGQDPRPGFVRVNELVRRGNDRKFDEWLSNMTSLVIDDVGAEYLDGKGFFRSLMDDVVDRFYSNRRTLVMTTNLRPSKSKTEEQDQFLERYGERVWSRMNQIGVWGDCGIRDLRKETP